MLTIWRFKFLFLFVLLLLWLWCVSDAVSVLAEEGCDTVFCGKAPEEVLADDIAGEVPGVSQAPNLFILILAWVGFFLPYAALLAFVGIIYAGFLYLTGFANEDNVGKAKSILLWSIVGLIVIFMSYAIVNTFVDPTG